MSATRLSLYNNTLILLGERQLSSVTENRPARKILDEIYALNPVNHCMEMAKPKFASVTAKLSSPVPSSQHTYPYVYTLPSDFLSFGAVYIDGNLQNPVDRYFQEGRTVATEIATNVYIRYISANADFTLWTPSFAQLVCAYMAVKAATRIAPDKLAAVEKEFKDMLASVLETESIQEPKQRPLKAIRTLDAFGVRLYNGVMQLLGQPLVVDNNDQSPARIALDYAIGLNGEGLNFCFEQIKPTFAMKTAALTGGTPSGVTGYTKTYTLPSDYLCLLGLFQDNLLDNTIDRFFIDGATLNTMYDPVYLRYIQNAPINANWSPAFFRYMCSYLANEISAEHALGETAQERMARQAGIQKMMPPLLQYVMQNEAYKEPAHRPIAPKFALTDAWRIVYNHALMLLKLPPILTNDDDSQTRYALDQTVNDNVVGSTLEIVPWAFGTIRAKLTYTVADSIPWGYAYRFDIPTDLLRIDMMCADEYFTQPAEFRQEVPYFYSDFQELYIRYVQTAMLTTPENWPLYFRNLVAARMAQMAQWLPKADSKELAKQIADYRSEAFSTDASRNPPAPIRAGSWVRARRGHRGGTIENNRFRSS